MVLIRWEDTAVKDMPACIALHKQAGWSEWAKQPLVSRMSQETIEALVEGGKATAAPPLGPSLGALKAPTKAIIDAINEKTKAMKGMQVPVKIHLDTTTKAFDIEVGTPPASALIKKELGLEKGAKEAGRERVGDLTEEQLKKIAELKFGKATAQTMNQVKGTARSMGISVGRGMVTEEERKAYEAAKAAREAEAAAKAAEKAAKAAAVTPAAGAVAEKAEAAPAGEKGEKKEAKPAPEKSEKPEKKK